jgi:hypothetical protein
MVIARGILSSIGTIFHTPRSNGCFNLCNELRLQRPSPLARGWPNIHLDKINQSVSCSRWIEMKQR